MVETRSQEAEMAQASDDEFWAAIDQRIEQAVKAEYERVNALLHEQGKVHKAVIKLIDQLQHTLDQRLDKAIKATDNLVTRVTALANGGPDGTGIVRKQTITPH
jgi:hypothetical protein